MTDGTMRADCKWLDVVGKLTVFIEAMQKDEGVSCFSCPAIEFCGREWEHQWGACHAVLKAWVRSEVAE